MELVIDVNYILISYYKNYLLYLKYKPSLFNEFFKKYFIYHLRANNLYSQT